MDSKVKIVKLINLFTFIISIFLIIIGLSIFFSVSYYSDFIAINEFGNQILGTTLVFLGGLGLLLEVYIVNKFFFNYSKCDMNK